MAQVYDEFLPVSRIFIFPIFIIVWIRIHKVAEYGSNLDPDPKHFRKIKDSVFKQLYRALTPKFLPQRAFCLGIYICIRIFNLFRLGIVSCHLHYILVYQSV